jgi:hypothetical protein
VAGHLVQRQQPNAYDLWRGQPTGDYGSGVAAPATAEIDLRWWRLAIVRGPGAKWRSMTAGEGEQVRGRRLSWTLRCLTTSTNRSADSIRFLKLLSHLIRNNDSAITTRCRWNGATASTSSTISTQKNA